MDYMMDECGLMWIIMIIMDVGGLLWITDWIMVENYCGLMDHWGLLWIIIGQY